MALLIFLVSYLFIAGLRIRRFPLDRPGGTFIGAVAMVLLGAVPLADVLGNGPARAIDEETLALLFGMMLLAGYLEEADFFRVAGYQTLRFSRSPRGLLLCTGILSAVLSAFLVNDTVCLMLTPLVLAATEEAKLPPLPYLLAVCMPANTGSVATFTGNPQNMLIQTASGMGYLDFARAMLLPAVLATAVILVGLLVAFHGQLPRRRFGALPPPPPPNRRLLGVTCGVLLGVVGGFFAGVHLGLCALTGAAAVMLLSGRPPRPALERVDYVLLLFFASLFVLVHGIHREGWAEWMRDQFQPLMAGGLWKEMTGFAALSLLASNLFSNVPFVMLARHWVPHLQAPELGWQVLALASTLAGNLTLVGSVANLIVFEMARERVQLSFWGYLRYGLPLTLLSFGLALAVLLFQHAAGAPTLLR